MGYDREYREDLASDLVNWQSRSGHNTAQSYYDAIRHIPRTNGTMNEFKHHVNMLEGLDSVHGNLYYSEKDELFVGDWSIQSPEIYHRHKELGTYFTMDGMEFTGHHDEDLVIMDSVGRYKTNIMWDAANGECGLCRERMSGEVMMMHKFYQF